MRHEGADGYETKMALLVLLRHGESEWNRSNPFTGSTDVGLTETGIALARAAGRLLEGMASASRSV